MTDALSERRLLRPRYVHFTCDRVWIVDDTQPVAVLLDPVTRQIDRIVDWSALPAGPRVMS